MIEISRKKTPVTSRRCFSTSKAEQLATALINKSVSFYCEPDPCGFWLFTVNAEAGHVIDSIMHDADCDTSM